MLYKVYITKEVTVQADSFEEACENAMEDVNCIMIDEYLDERNNLEDEEEF